MPNTATQDLAERFLMNLPYEPNTEQLNLIGALAHFCMLPRGTEALFLLNGHAGTGKTSMTGALVKTLSQMNVRTVLLAPTGRAAKVFAEYAHRSAYTIHRRIYRQNAYSPDGGGGFTLAENRNVDTVFIVDEASMIPNASQEGAVFGSGCLLDDLVHYVYSGINCKLILLGDSAQLPPVGCDEIPALNISRLQGYGVDVYTASLTHSARQDEDSGIIHNATILRHEMQQGITQPPQLDTESFADFQSLSGEYMTEIISDCYDRDGIQNTIIVTRSNKRATLFNTGIRNRILYREEELVPGDRLLIAKNNYLWSADYEEIDFIANGDMATVQRVVSTTRQYGFRFAKVELLLNDRDIELEAIINLDTLISDAPALTREQQQKLFEQVYSELTGDKRTRYKALKAHPYFNALQVKYAYAVTCHKAQGGQWRNVFVDMGYIPEEALTSPTLYRWLYTAITRAQKQVYILG